MCTIAVRRFILQICLSILRTCESAGGEGDNHCKGIDRFAERKIKAAHFLGMLEDARDQQA